jgi:peptide/nickel transport system substrate-binding protein
MAQMEEVLAPDARTVVVKWNRPYADAAVLRDGFQALPRHILAADFETMDPVAFTAHPFWILEYVGLGPYKMDRYEPGAFIEGTAFDQYVLGRPKIDHLKLVFINDPQTAVANVLAGEVHFVTNFMFSVLQGQELEERFAQTNGGRVMYSPTQRRLGLIQMRPEAQEPRALSDVRVRYAVAHGLDHKSRVDVLDAGKGQIAYTLTSPGVPYYAELDKAVLKHDFDPGKAQELMQQAGWTKGSDGIFVDGAGNRFTIRVASSSGEKNEQEAALYVDSLKRSGFDAQQYITPVAQVSDTQARALSPGLSLRGAGWQLQNYVSRQIPSEANRWRGNNRPGWNSPEFDRLFAQLETTFAANDRVKLIAQIEHVVSVDRAITMNTWESLVNSIAADLEGPEPRMTPDAGGTESWVHTWHWRS